jgi:serine beta-lactamase-like protein LACTB, mitochondrial
MPRGSAAFARERDWTARPVVLALLVYAAAACAHHAAPAAPVAGDRASPGCAVSREVLEAAVRDVHDRQRNVGLSAAILRHRRLVASFSLGWADAERRTPVTARTRFGIASITKAFTGTALLMLYDRGRLDLDAPIQQYVPSFPPKPGGPITPRLLAAHLAGIRHWGTERNDDLYARHFDDVTGVLPLFQDDPLVAPPGSKYSYSSYGYNLLAAAIQTAAGMRFQRFVESAIIAPLGLDNTGFDDVRRADPELAKRYSFFDVRTYARLNEPVEVPRWDYSHNTAGGNMYSTAEDLVRFGRTVVAPGLLSRRSLELVSRRPRVNGVESPMAAGWFVGDPAAAPRELDITGSNAGLQASLYVFPDADLEIAVLSNTWGIGSQSGDMVELPLRLGRLCLGATLPVAGDR